MRYYFIMVTIPWRQLIAIREELLFGIKILL